MARRDDPVTCMPPPTVERSVFRRARACSSQQRESARREAPGGASVREIPLKIASNRLMQTRSSTVQRLKGEIVLLDIQFGSAWVRRQVPEAMWAARM